MQIVWDINNYHSDRDHVVSLGTFDGVHLGHQAILAKLKEKSAQTDSVASMITFEPHPQLVVQREFQASVHILTTIEEKIEIFTELGLDQLVVAHFTRSLAGMAPERFIEHILLDRLHMKQVIIGHDHAFGHGRSGNFQLLEKMGAERGFIVSALEPVQVDGHTVSSTKIRHFLLRGEVKKAARLLGRPYMLQGQVVGGDERGRRLGFPTINLRPFSQYKLVPGPGIYATRLLIDGESHQSVTYIGSRPTFNGLEKVIESHVFDFDRDVYGKAVEISFAEFIREDKKFGDEDGLVDQIKKDLQVTLELFKKETS